jgi:integrase
VPREEFTSGDDYGVLAGEGMRASELEALRWRDVDLTLGLVRLDENKTDDPRAWALSPDVARTLACWKEEIGGSADERVFDWT